MGLFSSARKKRSMMGGYGYYGGYRHSSSSGHRHYDPRYAQPRPSKGQTLINAAGSAIGGAAGACPQCGAAVPAGAKFCMHCGKEIGGGFCMHCGAAIPAGAKFCMACGKPRD